MYKMPSAYTVYIYVWEKVKDFFNESRNDDFHCFNCYLDLDAYWNEWIYS